MRNVDATRPLTDLSVSGRRAAVFPNSDVPDRPLDPDSSSRGLVGYVGLQAHGSAPDVVSYRDVRIRELPPVHVEVDARCLAGTAHVAVRALNVGEDAVDVTLGTAAGERAFADVQPGRNAYQSFSTRASSVEPGRYGRTLPIVDLPEFLLLASRS